MLPASNRRGEDHDGVPQAGGRSSSSGHHSSRRTAAHAPPGTGEADAADAVAAAAVAAAGGFGGGGGGGDRSRERAVSFSGRGPAPVAAAAAPAAQQGAGEDENVLRDMNFNGLVLRLKPDGLLYLDVRGLTCTVGREKAFKGKMARELRYVDTYYKNAETGVMKAISNGEEYPAIANRLPALGSEDDTGGGGGGAHPRASRRKRAAADRKLRRDKGRRRRNYVTSVFLPLLRFVAVNSLAACCLIKKHVQVSRTRSASAAAAAAAADAAEASSSDDDETSHPDAAAAAAAAAVPSAASPSSSSQQQQEQQPLPTSEEVCRAYLEKTVFFNALQTSPLFEHALVKRSLLEYYHDIVACGEASVPPLAPPPPCGYQSSSSGGDGKDADGVEEQSPLFEAAACLWQAEGGAGGVGGGGMLPSCVACEDRSVPVPYPCPITSCDHTFCWDCVVRSGLGEGIMTCPECGKPLVLPPLFAVHEHELGLVGDAASSTDASMETDSAPTSSAGPSPAGAGGAAAAATAKLQYFCKDCKMRLNSFRQAQIHVNGQRHWDQVQRLRERSMRSGKEYESAGLHVFEGDGTPVPERRKAKRNRGSKKRLVVADESDATTG